MIQDLNQWKVVQQPLQIIKFGFSEDPNQKMMKTPSHKKSPDSGSFTEVGFNIPELETILLDTHCPDHLFSISTVNTFENHFLNS